MNDRNNNPIRVGQPVQVPDPSPTDIHYHAFIGTVAVLFPEKGTVLVEDQDSDFYEIEAGRLWYRDYVQADGGIATMEALNAAFELKGIDGNGMTRSDREYLRRLVESDEPMGVETLASALGESPETLEESIEPFLLRQGFIQRTPRGRVAIKRVQELLGTGEQNEN